MQFKEALKLKGKSVAVIPPWKYAGKQYKTVNTVAENSIVRARLVDEKSYSPANNSYDKPDSMGNYVRTFALASESERVKGLLFQTEGSDDPNDDGIRFVIRASDVVGEWDEVDKRFVERRSERDASQRESERQRELISRAEEPLEATIPAMKDSLRKTVGNLLGKNIPDHEFEARLSVTGEWVDPTNPQEYNARIKGNVMVDVNSFQQLLEDFYDAREELADLREQVANREEVNV
jgi:hypothetical protein